MPASPLDLAALIDLDFGDFSEDLEVYENFARRIEGPILEVGVGTGRAAIPLAQAGFDVWGIDNNDAMLARAEVNTPSEVAERMHLSNADMREFAIEQKFALVFAGFGAFHHLLTTSDQERCLRSVREHLVPGGLFVCDLRPLLEDEWEFGESTPLFYDWTRTMPETDDTVMRSHTVHSDGARQLKRQTNIYDIMNEEGVVRRVLNEVDLRFTTRYEMEGLLDRTGLELDNIYGDYDLTPYDDASEYMITVARKPEDGS